MNKKQNLQKGVAADGTVGCKKKKKLETNIFLK
jgi:hypothetical protein